MDGLTVASRTCCISSSTLLPYCYLSLHVEWSIEIYPLVTRQVITLPVSHDMVLLSLDCTGTLWGSLSGSDPLEVDQSIKPIVRPLIYLVYTAPGLCLYIHTTQIPVCCIGG